MQQQPAITGVLGFQPHRGPGRAQSHPVRQHGRVPQPGIDRRALPQDALGRGGIGLLIPVTRLLRPAQHDRVLVREQVGDVTGSLADPDEELADPRVGRHHDLTPDRQHGRIGNEVMRANASAVHDHVRAGLPGGGRQRRENAVILDLAARVQEPGQQVVEVSGHGDHGRGEPPAAREPVRKLGILAALSLADTIGPGRWLRRLRGAKAGDAADRPHAGGRVAGQVPQPGECHLPPPGDALVQANQMRAPDRPGRGRGRTPRRPGRRDIDDEPGLGQADRRRQAGHAGSDHQHIDLSAAHLPTVARTALRPAAA